MNSRQKEFLLASANYGNICCDVSHDINNPLAILVGYTEELEILYKKNEPVAKERLEFIHKKLMAAIEKLERKAKEMGGLRRVSGADENTLNVIQIVTRWSKLVEPRVSKWNFRFSPQWEGEQLHYVVPFDSLNELLSMFVGQWLEKHQPTEPQVIILTTICKPDGFHLRFAADKGQLPPPPTASWRGKALTPKQQDGGFVIEITAQSVKPATNAPI